MEHTVLKIAGMSCRHCVGAVEKALAGLGGVTVENVAVGTATVRHDPEAISRQQIADAVSEAGYAAAASS